MFGEIIIGGTIASVVENDDNTTILTFTEIYTQNTVNITLEDSNLGYLVGMLKTVLENK